MKANFKLGSLHNNFETTNKYYYEKSNPPGEPSNLALKMKKTHLVYGFSKVDYSWQTSNKGSKPINHPAG